MQTEKGRTLVELLATISIITLMTVGVIKTYQFIMNQTKAQNTAKMIKTLALERQNSAIGDNTRAEMTIRGPHSSLHVENGVEGNHQPYFWVDTIVKDSAFCQALKDSSLIQADFVEVNGIQDGACADNATISFFFKKSPQGGIYCPANSLACNQWGDATTCKDGYYLDHGTCSACGEHVATCKDAETPLTCMDGYELLWGSCIEPKICTTDLQCSVCGECDAETGYCKGECTIPTPDANDGCGNNDCIAYDSTTKTCKNICTHVGYLENTQKGTSRNWISTGIVPDTTTRWEVRIEFNNTTTGKLMGSGCADPNRFNMGIETNKFRFAFNSWFDANSNITTPDTNAHTWIMDASSKTFTIDEYSVTSTKTFVATTFPICLFGRSCNASGTTETNYAADGKIYYSKIWKAGTLVQDLIPVLVKQSNGTQKPAMFDRVNEKLYYNANQNGDDFQYGDDN